MRPSSPPRFSGRQKLEFARRLENNWRDLADYFEIAPAQRQGFTPGREAQEVWEWLEARGKLADVLEALRYIGREDIVLTSERGCTCERHIMRIAGIIWLDTIVAKPAVKHRGEPEEVEEVFTNSPRFRFIEKGERINEDVYMALGQTDSGRYLTVLFIHKTTADVLILSARDMAENEPTALPRFHSLQDLVEFFDTHDMGDYLEHMPEADFEVDMQRKSYLVSVDADLMSQITSMAKSQHVTVETLIDSWLREKVAGSRH